MNQRIALAAVLCLATVFGHIQAQELSAEGCLVPTQQNNSHVRWVKDADGNLKAIKSSSKEMIVARVIFIGHPDAPPLVQDRIATSLSGRRYNADDSGMEEVIDRVRDDWQQQGYFRAEAKLGGSQVLDETAESRTVALTVYVDAGKPYRLDTIDFQATTSHPAFRSRSSLAPAEERKPFSVEELRAFFSIQQGEIFDTHKLQDGIAALRKGYGAKGYINVVVVPTFQIDEKTDRIVLTVEIEEGPQFRIGRIRVLGLDPVVSRKLLEHSGLVPGNAFDATSLDRFYRDTKVTLPTGFSPEDYVERRIDDQRGIVDLFMRVPCPAP